MKDEKLIIESVFETLYEIMGPAVGSIMYLAGIRFARKKGIKSFEELKITTLDLELGSIEEVKKHKTYKLSAEADYGIHNQFPTHNFVRGMIAGMIENEKGVLPEVDETSCTALGQEECKFVVR